MRVLVACEESQRVCKAFRARGHEAYSCDIIEPSGGHPEWHILGDALKIINPNDINGINGIFFKTMSGAEHWIERWDLVIAHPPCTYLTVSGNRWFSEARYGERAKKRKEQREEAANFFMRFINANCEKIAVENPIGVMSTRYRKPDQIIQPFYFGEPYTKQTCFWLKGLPLLQPTNILKRPPEGWENQQFTKDGRYGGFNSTWGVEGSKVRRYGDPEVKKERSKTFEGIAAAMAEQWG